VGKNGKKDEVDFGTSHEVSDGEYIIALLFL